METTKRLLNPDGLQSNPIFHHNGSLSRAVLLLDLPLSDITELNTIEEARFKILSLPWLSIGKSGSRFDIRDQGEHQKSVS